MTDITIRRRSRDTLPFLPDVIAATDANTSALGFFCAGVYREAIDEGRLWIVARSGRYSGHLFFGGVKPTLKIKQLFVTPGSRGQGLARRLIEALVGYAEESGYGSIRARVAEDLDANEAWARLGFEVVGVVRRGPTSNRKLLVRFRRVMPRGRQQHFLDLCDRRDKELQRVRALGLPINRTDCYTLDVNVWLDFVRGREPFADAARALVQQAATSQVRLRVTEEMLREATRTAAGRSPDPLLDFALSWPRLTGGAEPADVDALQAELRPLVFPRRALDGRRAAQDRSDLRHLALSILSDATGFVTREKALLRARDDLFERYDFAVVSPTDLIEPRHEFEPTTAPIGLEGRTLRLEDIDGHRPAVRALIGRRFGGRPTRDPQLDAECAGVACLLDDEAVGVVHWPSSTARAPEAHLAMEGSGNLSVELRQQVFDVLIGWLLFHVRPTRGASRILLQVDLQTGEGFARELERAGFFPTSRPDDFVRFVLAAPGHVPTWKDIAPAVERELGARSKWLGGVDDGPVLRLQFEDGVYHFDRFAFETTFGPTADTVRGRPVWYIPIKRHLRDELLPLARQRALFRRRDAAWRAERVYFRSPKKPHPAPGDLLLFYVSKPTSAVVGLARCTASQVVDVEQARARFARQAVIDPSDAARGGHVHSIVFDNYLPLSTELKVGELRGLGVWPAQGILSVTRVPGGLEALGLADLTGR